MRKVGLKLNYLGWQDLEKVILRQDLVDCSEPHIRSVSVPGESVDQYLKYFTFSLQFCQLIMINEVLDKKC